MNKSYALLAASAVLLTACGSVPSHKPEISDKPIKPAPVSNGRGGYLPGDGPGANIPDNLDSIPDAVPRAEPLHPYANRPYAALGKNYTPLTDIGSYQERGIASWYGAKFHGENTSSGELYDMYKMTAAHPTLPIPSYARVTNLRNNKTIVVRINDRGPFLHDRIIDLSYTAAYKLGMIGGGSTEVEVESLAVGSGTPRVTSSNVMTANYAAPGKPRTAATVSDSGERPVHSSGRPFGYTPASAVHSEPLRAEPVAENKPVATTPAPASTNSAPVAGGIYLQLGAFHAQKGADEFMAKMRGETADSGKTVSLASRPDGLIRVQLGPFSSPESARATADKLKDKLGFKPLLVGR